MHDIREEREDDMDRNNKSPEIGEITNDENKTPNCVFSNESHPIMAPQRVILEHLTVQGFSLKTPMYITSLCHVLN